MGADGKRTRKLRLRLGQEEMMQTFSAASCSGSSSFATGSSPSSASSSPPPCSSISAAAPTRQTVRVGTDSAVFRARRGRCALLVARLGPLGINLSDTEKDKALAAVFLDAIQMLALLGLTVYHFYYKSKIQEEVDNSTITMEDYSIEVRGLPLDATEESVRERTSSDSAVPCTR